MRTNFQLKRFKRTYSLQVTKILREHILSHYFVKPFLLKTIITFCLLASFSARQEDHFQKIDVQNKTDFPFRFCKIGLRNTLLLKNGRLFLFVFLFVCCNNLSDFGLLFLKIEALLELRKMFLRKKLFDVRLGNLNCSTPKVPIFCRFT